MTDIQKQAQDILPIIEKLASGEIGLDDVEEEWRGEKGTWRPVTGDDLRPMSRGYRYRLKPKPIEVWVLRQISDGEIYSPYTYDEMMNSCFLHDSDHEFVKLREVTDE